MFHEYSKQGSEIMEWYEQVLDIISNSFDVTYKSPPHDIARRFLNEIVEFKRIGE